jgi:hypothetical protein
MNSLFGPLSHSYCNLFLFLSFLGLVALFVVILAGLVIVAKKGMSSFEGFLFLQAIIVYTIMYIQNRILYNICKVV